MCIIVLHTVDGNQCIYIVPYNLYPDCIAVTLGEDTSALHADQFVVHVKEMHARRDKGFEEEFQVNKHTITA